jgi:glycosyltransferase involved in cell wall biosynthesis
MRIAIAYNFNDHDWFGGRNYFASLFTALHKISPPQLEMVLVMGHKTVSNLPEEFPWVTTIRTSLMDRMHPSWLLRQLTLRTLGTDPLLEVFLNRKGVDLLSHSTQFGQGSRIKTLPWLYDFQFMHLPELWTDKQIRWSKKRYTNACRLGDGVIVSSQDAAHDLKIFAPGYSQPIYVMPFVSNPVNFDCLPSSEDIRKRYNLPSKYFHLPNQFWANKNHRLVIDSLALLRQSGIDVTIACTGKTFDGRLPQYFDQLMAHCRAQGVEDRFRILGTVPQSDLQGLMAHSTGVINPSRFEGWSTTVEEAKTMHKTLLLSDIAVHREQASQFGKFFPPDDVKTLANLLIEAQELGPKPLIGRDICIDYEHRLRAFGQEYYSAIEATLGYS